MARKPRLRRMVVKEVVPGRTWVVSLAVLALVVLAGACGWVAGRHVLLTGLVGSAGQVDGVALLERLAEENHSMRNELAVSRNGSELSREVEERVRTDNRDLQDRVAELEQALVSYRRAVPDTGGKGLQIEHLSVSQIGSAWKMSLALVRTGGTDSTVEGYLQGTLQADGPAGRVALPLSDVLPPGQAAFRARYVTEMNQELRLPAALVPVRLDVVAVLTAPRPGRVEKSWQRKTARVQEGVRHVGQE
jgi:hypothetical protein